VSLLNEEAQNGNNEFRRVCHEEPNHCADALYKHRNQPSDEIASQQSIHIRNVFNLKTT
jgi:hypothetical protein